MLTHGALLPSWRCPARNGVTTSEACGSAVPDHGRMHSAAPVDLDVLIIGAGLSGIGVAWHLHSRHPQRTYAVTEPERSGGT